MTIRRPDGSWIFHFVNVVDDIEMGISARDSRRGPPLQHPEAPPALPCTRCFRAPVRPHPAHPEPGWLENEQARPGGELEQLQGAGLPARKRCAIIFACSVGRRRITAKKSTSRKSSSFRPGKGEPAQRGVRSRQMLLAERAVSRADEPDSIQGTRNAIPRKCRHRFWIRRSAAACARDREGKDQAPE